MKDDAARSELAVFISIRSILFVGAAVAVGWALKSVGHVVLLVFLAAFNAAVLAPVVDAMDRRLPWSRGMCSTVLVLGLSVAFVPENVPGLTLPGSPEAAQAMKAMGMQPKEGKTPSMSPERQMGSGQMKP